MKYIIVSNSDLDQLSLGVEYYLDKGYKLAGGVSACLSGQYIETGTRYYQAMIREGREDETDKV